MRIKSPNYAKEGFLMKQALQDFVKLQRTFVEVLLLFDCFSLHYFFCHPSIAGILGFLLEILNIRKYLKIEIY